MADQPSLPEDRNVEDVLSSIRKLVSAEAEARLTESQRAYARRTARNEEPHKAIRPNGDAKPLLLSTALRVSDEDPNTTDPVEDAGQELNGTAHSVSESDPAPVNGSADSAEPLKLVPANGEDTSTDLADRGDPKADEAVEPEAQVEAATSEKRPAGRLTLQAPQDQIGEVETGDDGLAEVALRELVRSVIREELEGEIGDRISRNLTQYVRKEIAKAIRIDPSDV